MASSANNPAGGRALTIMGEVGQLIGLGVPIAGEVVPLIIGLVKSIKANRNAAGDVDYTIEISSGQKHLDEADANFDEALAAINEERKAQGLEPLDVS